MKIGDLKRYLRMYRASPGGDAPSHTLMVSAINEGVRKAAMVLIDAKDPWMISSWDFTMEYGKSSYKVFKDIASVQVSDHIKDIENFAKPHSLRVRSQDGQSWVPVALVDILEQAKYSSSGDFFPVASYSMVAGEGNYEHDYQITFAVAPKADVDARISFYALPSPAPDGVEDIYEPAIPEIANRYVKLSALVELSIMTGNFELADRVSGLLIAEEQKLRMNAHGGIGEDPQYVSQDSSDADRDYIQLIGLL